MDTGKENLIFGLDIGTRSVVGTVGYRTSAREFVAIAQSVRFHETRAMLDGQIHDIGAVAATIGEVKRELETKTGTKLTGVCIAAAGRVLKTRQVRIDYDLEGEAVIDNGMIHTMELMGVEKASDMLRREEKGGGNYFCVGFSVTKYYLGDVAIMNLEGHKGTAIGADLLATFLPRDVTDGLYAATDRAGLEVINLTLEPIAAINIAIPQKFRLLNLALVDVGAGTSDICITSEGSVTAYGMIPKAGDFFTEAIMQKYLVEFSVAESMKIGLSGKRKKITYKDIIGTKKSVAVEEVMASVTEPMKELARMIADKVKELNGGKSPSAVFFVGGGGKIPGFTDMIASALKISPERVTLRGAEVLGEVRFVEENIKKDPMLVTPIGICLNYYEQNNNFIFARVNGELLRLYDNGHLTVMDAAMGIGIDTTSLFPRRGDGVSFTFNGKSRLVRGEAGEGAVIKVNGQLGAISTPIVRGDEVVITPSTKGEAASVSVESLAEGARSICFNVNGHKVTAPRLLLVNGREAEPDMFVQNGDNIEEADYYTAGRLLEYMDVEAGGTISINNIPALPSDRVYENFTIDFEIVGDDTLLDNHNEMVQDVSDVSTNGEESDTAGAKSSAEYGAKPAQQSIAGAGSGGSETDKNDRQSGEANVKAAGPAGIHSITVIVNGMPVALNGKDLYRLVDVLDVYPGFDTRNPKGDRAVIRINGADSDFIHEIYGGDQIELRWE
ncbi:MAG: rod shape-determining protein [Lachnospiraceae bacterium]|nr:rod shape-determining protein [Lachnospiraceae bacterium]